MPKQTPEVMTGARGPRGPETVTHTPGPEQYPQVRERVLVEEEAHFVSRFREYSIVIATEPDHVNSSGQIVRGKNKSVRFKDFALVTRDPDVVNKIRGMREYGLGREVWEKRDQDAALAAQAIANVMDAIDALPPDMQSKAMEKLEAKFSSFQLKPRVAGDGESGDSN